MEGAVLLYWEAVHSLLETYLTDGIIAETDEDMRSFRQLSIKSPTEYTEALWNKVLRGARVYDEYVLKRIFIERL